MHDTPNDAPPQTFVALPAPGATAAPRRGSPPSRYYGETRSTASSQAHFMHLRCLPIDRFDRVELLNDVTGRELRVFRNSPFPPRASSPASDDETSSSVSDDDTADRPFARGRRFVLINDVAGRVFRKSPCPPRARSPASDTAYGASDTECSNDAAARELKLSPCLHLERRPSRVGDATG
ncbi:hypothetical protein T484DRAFT_1922970 [Baffinella frigidus]|nr:hypothetical protein T484DRAFT_1922970 [Cryptophyta sp. CCMP2293]